MQRYFRFVSLFLLSLNTCLFALESSSLTLSHTEGKGLGYSEGYSSLDLFLAKPSCFDPMTPFVDLRGHVFNNGKWATNSGVGLRWLTPCQQIWGINAFYDSFQSDRRYYHQLGIGGEVLTETWEFHLNGYLPVGRTKTNIYTLSYGSFADGFLAEAKEQFAMDGVDAELGYNFCNIPRINLYAGIGPYFYWGRSEKTENAFRSTRKKVFGGRLHASAEFLNYFILEGVTSYDSRFKWCGQVTLSLRVPFGCPSNFQQSCAPCTLRERLFQPVVRNEMMVIDRITRKSSNPDILDPEFEL